MSALHRKGSRRKKQDDYPTPGQVTRLILPYLDEAGALSGSILEPACGEGAIVKELIDYGVDRQRIQGIDINEKRAAYCRNTYLIAVNLRNGFRHDFLEHRWFPSWDLIITNPPYSRGLDYVKHALLSVRARGHVAMLLRLGFMASKARGQFHRDNPSDVYVLEKRPGFVLEHKGTDMSEYAWFHWWPGATRKWIVI